MQDYQPKTAKEQGSLVLELNPIAVHRTIAAQKVPQKTVMFAIYRGELVTHAQALELREADRR